MEAKRWEHVILFPFMAQGHIIPFLALALDIEKRGYEVTIINTPLNISNLRSLLSVRSSSITLREIPFESTDHGLPPNSENTDNLPYKYILRLFEVSTSLKPAFKQLVEAIIDETLSRPLCIIADIFFGWTAEIAREYDIYHSIFVANSGFGIAMYYSLWTSLPLWKVEGATVFINDDFRDSGQIHISQLPANMTAANETDSGSVYVKMRLDEWRASNSLLFNTLEEIDQVGLQYFRRKLGLPIYSIGPVLLEKYMITSHECLEWLDTKLTRSVLYICFGTQSTLAKCQMMELATALEYMKKPFIWVVRPPLGVDYKSDYKADEWLPRGFEQRIREQNMRLLVTKWAPQREILSHKSVGAFLSHCGWNSALESMSHGIPILGWPMAAEQFFNSKFLVEWVGNCVELGRGNQSEVKHEDIIKKVDMVMGENDDADRLWKRACEVRGVIQDTKTADINCKGSSVRAMDEFFTAATSSRHRSSINNANVSNLISSREGSN